MFCCSCFVKDDGTPGEAQPVACDDIKAGMVMVLGDIESKKHLNGRYVVVEKWIKCADHDIGRWQVKLLETSYHAAAESASDDVIKVLPQKLGFWDTACNELQSGEVAGLNVDDKVVLCGLSDNYFEYENQLGKILSFNMAISEKAEVKLPYKNDRIVKLRACRVVVLKPSPISNATRAVPSQTSRSIPVLTNYAEMPIRDAVPVGGPDVALGQVYSTMGSSNAIDTPAATAVS